MWKDFSSSYIKNNRTSCLSVIIAAFISALLLSVLCGLFYNMWKYEVERIKLEEGDWQSRVVVTDSGNDIKVIQRFANVEKVVINEKESNGTEKAIDIYFKSYRDVFDTTPIIAERVGCPTEAITYNYELLAMYLVRDSNDSAPRLLFPLFILITVLASISLIVIIHNSFAVTMNARIHQFGILSSIGATPKQIRRCLQQEAGALCAVPVLLGNLLGIAICMALLQLVNILLGSDVAGRHEAVFGYHPMVLAVTLVVTIITIWISAWLPARKLARLTPLEAIRNSNELSLKRRSKSPILAFFFGIAGEMAGNALKAQRKALRTASLSLVFSLMAFTIMQCFVTLSQISTRETYFERYQDKWDIMVTVKDTDIETFNKYNRIQTISGVRNAITYQKAMAKTLITSEDMSDEMKAFGGFDHAKDKDAKKTDNGWLVTAPIVVLDDVSFLNYCEQVGIKPQLNGAIIRNQIRDVTNPDFRHPHYMPYVKGKKLTTELQTFDLKSGNEIVKEEIPVLSYTDKVPVLREEYENSSYYEMVHFISQSLWKEIKGQIAGSDEDTYISILGTQGVTLEELNTLQKEIKHCIGNGYVMDFENRIQKQNTNDNQIFGMLALWSGFCVLLAIIGIGNVFSNTLGFIRQRKREFARYMSVGLTPAEIKKMFCIEAVVIAGRPVLITLPIAVLAVWFMLRSSYMEASVFFIEAPFVPVAVFMLAIVGTVAFAYYLGWRNIGKINLPEVLRDDTML